MGSAEWLGPLAAALIAVGLAALAPSPAPAPEASPAWPDASLRTPFSQVAADRGTTTLLGVWDRDVAVVEGAVLAPQPGVEVHQATSRLVWVTLGPGLLADGQGNRVAEVYEGTAPRVGPGREAATVAIYVFRGNGLLLATTEAEHGRFAKDRDFTPLQDGLVWYFGSGATPQGMHAVPDTLAQERLELRGAIEGLPQGGVATLRIATGPVADVFGPVHVTMLLEELHATP